MRLFTSQQTLMWTSQHVSSFTTHTAACVRASITLPSVKGSFEVLVFKHSLMINPWGINTFSAGSRQMLHNNQGLCWTPLSAWRALFSCSALTFNLWNKYLQSPHADLHICALIKTTLVSHSILNTNTQHVHWKINSQRALAAFLSIFNIFQPFDNIQDIYCISMFTALNGLNY